jgi:hypothetical protein
VGVIDPKGLTVMNERGHQPGRADAIVRNEFAAVRVEIDRSANSPRLRVEDLQSGACIFLDALELASLASATHGMIEFLQDPSLARWRTAEAGAFGHETEVGL